MSEYRYVTARDRALGFAQAMGTFGHPEYEETVLREHELELD